jgi:hypothetical protein
MKCALCPELVPQQVQSILLEWKRDDGRITEFVEMVLNEVKTEDFGTSILEQTDSMYACEIITTLVQMRVLSIQERETFILTELPHEDFEDEDFQSWDGLNLAIMFADAELVQRIVSKIPLDHISTALDVLPPGSQEAGRLIFYN